MEWSHDMTRIESVYKWNEVIIWQEYSRYIDGMKLSYDKNRVSIYYTFSLHRSRGVPSGSSSRSRSACNSLHTSTVSRKGKVSFIESNNSRGHQHVVHCVVGHIVAVETSSQSIHKKSRKTRERRVILSANRMYTSRPTRSFIFVERMSIQEWYSCTRRLALHSLVWETVADFEMAGIIPSKRQA